MTTFLEDLDKTLIETRAFIKTLKKSKDKPLLMSDEQREFRGALNTIEYRDLKDNVVLRVNVETGYLHYAKSRSAKYGKYVRRRNGTVVNYSDSDYLNVINKIISI